MLVLNVSYCSLALMVDELPGWKMFESVEKLDYAFVDRAGRAIDLHEVLPQRAHLIDHRQLRRSAHWYCGRYADHGPFHYTEGDAPPQALVAPECQIHDSR